MDKFLLALSLLLLLLIAWHDINYRSIPVLILVPEAAVAVIAMALLKLPGYWQMIFLSFVAAFLQILMLWGWFRLIRKSDCFFDVMFGWGDLTMILIVAIHFSVFPFIVFLMISSFAGLLWYFVSRLTVRSESFKVPFAGIMALMLIPVQITGFFGSGWFYYNPISI